MTMLNPLTETRASSLMTRMNATNSFAVGIDRELSGRADLGLAGKSGGGE